MKSGLQMVGLMVVLACLSVCAVETGLRPFPEFSAPRAVTSGPHDHLLANYFGINAWSPDNRYLLVLETDLKDKLPDGRSCTLGLVDTQDGKSASIPSTKAPVRSM